MRIGTLALSCTALAAAGCGGASTTSATASDVAAISAYQQRSMDVQSAATAYGAAMAASGMTAGGCASVHDAYDAQVRPWLSQMVQAGAAMDASMAARGGSGYADMSCVASAMMAELDAHRAIACTFATVEEDRTEAARHVGVMTSDASHLSDRCGTMMGGSGSMMGGSGGYAWGPNAAGCGGTSGGTGGGATDPVAVGQRIFDSGIGADGRAIPRTGGLGMMGTSGCASCHGLDGHGRVTMMFTSPNVTYANLTDPAGMRDPDGSRGPTYTDELIRRAVGSGVDAEGQTLSTVMPRWQLEDADWADLLAYLKTLP